MSTCEDRRQDKRRSRAPPLTAETPRSCQEEGGPDWEALGWAGPGSGHGGLRAGLPEDDLHGLDPGLQFSARAEEAEGRWRGVGEAGEHATPIPAPELARQVPPLRPLATEGLWVLTRMVSLFTHW